VVATVNNSLSALHPELSLIGQNGTDDEAEIRKQLNGLRAKADLIFDDVVDPPALTTVALYSTQKLPADLLSRPIREFYYLGASPVASTAIKMVVVVTRDDEDRMKIEVEVKKSTRHLYRLLTARIADRRDPEYSNILRIGSGSHSEFVQNDWNGDPLEGF
jgi:hypothetical protein